MEKQLASLAIVLLLAGGSFAQNFVVKGDSDFCRRVEQLAERKADELSRRFFGKPFPQLDGPYVITPVVTTDRASGVTSHTTREMGVRGTVDEIYGNAVPHEVLHVVTAAHFNRSTPVWFDEGLAGYAERDFIELDARRLTTYLTTSRGIPFNVILNQREYASDIRPQYVQSASMVNFLLQQDVPQRLPLMVECAHREGWNAALRKHYGYADTSEFQLNWVDWVKSGSPVVRAKWNYPIRRWIRGTWRLVFMGGPRFPIVRTLGGMVLGPQNYASQLRQPAPSGGT